MELFYYNLGCGPHGLVWANSVEDAQRKVIDYFGEECVYKHIGEAEPAIYPLDDDINSKEFFVLDY